MDDLLHWLTPARYLVVAGLLLMVLGCAGLSGILGRLSSAAFFHPPYWINGVHLGFGAVLLVLAFSPLANVQAAFVLAGAVLGSGFGTAGLLFGPFAARHFKKPELADRSDHLAHLIVGVIAFWAWHGRGLP
jgi:hypothetical protein